MSTNYYWRVTQDDEESVLPDVGDSNPSIHIGKFASCTPRTGFPHAKVLRESTVRTTFAWTQHFVGSRIYAERLSEGPAVFSVTIQAAGT